MAKYASWNSLCTLRATGTTRPERMTASAALKRSTLARFTR